MIDSNEIKMLMAAEGNVTHCSDGFKQWISMAQTHFSKIITGCTQFCAILCRVSILFTEKNK